MTSFHRLFFSHIKPLKSASTASHLETTTLSNNLQKNYHFAQRKKGEEKREGLVQGNREKKPQGQGQSCFYALIVDNSKFHFKEKMRQNRGSQRHRLMQTIHKQNGINIYILQIQIEFQDKFQDTTSQIKAKIHLVPESLRPCPSQPMEGSVLVPSMKSSLAG